MAKRRAVSYYNSIKVCRREWKHSRPRRCMSCMEVFPWDRLEVHEIERRSMASNKWWPITDEGRHCNGLLLCRECHSGQFATMPHAKQLALKAVMDPENYDLQAWLDIKPRPSTYATQEEVDEYMKEWT
jgi:hypothetical protein